MVSLDVNCRLTVKRRYGRLEILGSEKIDQGSSECALPAALRTLHGDHQWPAGPGTAKGSMVLGDERREEACFIRRRACVCAVHWRGSSDLGVGV